jgi:L-asparaginase
MFLTMLDVRTLVRFSLFSLLIVLPASAGDRLPRVHVLGTGGTIASKGRDALELSGYSIALTARELVEALPGLDRIAAVTTEQFSNVGSFAITPELWLRLARRVHEIFEREPDAAGIVVLHGTDTLEETAYFLHLAVQSDRPVVVAGAMRPASALSADGPLNLVAAIRTAASPDARGKGVLVLLNEQISSARDATKQSTYRADAFHPGEAGYLGSVDADRVVFYRSPLRRHTRSSEFRVEGLAALPRVDIVYSYAGADGVAVDALTKAGARGIVVAGTGAGDMTLAESDAVLRAREAGVVVVRGSRVGSGRVFDAAAKGGKSPRPWYGEHGIVNADNLTPQKARVLLMLALTVTQSPQELQRIFDQY